jgi:hypothetical protein
MEARSRAATGCWSLQHADQRKKRTTILRSDQEEGGLDLEFLPTSAEQSTMAREVLRPHEESRQKTPMPSLQWARIYGSPDPLFAKLPKLQTPIAKRLETTFCAFCQKIILPNSNAQPLDML